MILTKLLLTDFGVFHGSQSFDLIPKPGRPIILFGGKNGAGKSSILEAIKLCFYGQGCSGARSKDEYHAYLAGKIHLNPISLIQPQYSSVRVEFQYGDMRSLHTYAVSRDWERKGPSRIHETLTVEKDGHPLDEVTAEHWQDFVRDLIPPGLSQLFFFDGEKIQELAEDATDQATLGNAIKSLLGLDVVETLQTDLAVYLSRASKTLRKDQRSDLEELENTIASLRERAAALRERKTIDENRISDLQTELRRIETQIASEGGNFARNRESLLQEEASCKARIEGYESSIREFCNGLLPFAIIPDLCHALQRQLEQEEVHAAREQARRILASTVEAFSGALPRLPMWDAVELAKSSREHAIREITNLLLCHAEKQSDDVVIVHDVSVSQRNQLMSWIDQATNNVPGLLKTTGAELERVYDGLRRAQDELRKIPADETLRPLIEKLQSIHREMADVSKTAFVHEEQLRSCELELSAAEKRYSQAVERLANETAVNARARLIPKIQSVLDDYKDALLVGRVRKLQDAVTDCFNTLCRKKDALRKIIIDPRNFSISLQDSAGNPLKKSLLSAGEKQIYAISMLWGLAKTSGRPLPVIIDTPLARLDSDHRLLLAHNYFPVASHQVIILSTDTEVDRTYFAEIRPSVAHSYKLEFQGTLGGTTSEKGYFWDIHDEAHEAEIDKRRVQSSAVLGR